MAARRDTDTDVDAFLHALKHSRKDEIEAIRAIVRAVVKFVDMQEIRARKTRLAKLVVRWMKATC